MGLNCHRIAYTQSVDYKSRENQPAEHSGMERWVAEPYLEDIIHFSHQRNSKEQDKNSPEFAGTLGKGEHTCAIAASFAGGNFGKKRTKHSTRKLIGLGRDLVGDTIGGVNSWTEVEVEQDSRTLVAENHSGTADQIPAGKRKDFFEPMLIKPLATADTAFVKDGYSPKDLRELDDDKNADHPNGVIQEPVAVGIGKGPSKNKGH